MACGNVEDIAQRARNVRQVAWLAVAVIQAREDAAGLEVALHPHEVEPCQELRLILAHRNAGFQRQRMVALNPILDPRTRPSDVAVAQQRHEIVGHGSKHGILEVDNAGVVVPGNQQVARVIIAVYPHLWLGARRTNEDFEGLIQDTALGAVQGEPQMAPEIPVAEQLHFAQQQRFAVAGQEAGGIGGECPGLEHHQGPQGVAVEPLDRGLGQMGQV